MSLTKTTVKEFRHDFGEVVKDLEKKFGIKIQLGNVSFNESMLRGKITATVVSKDNLDNPNAAYEKNHSLYYSRYELPKDLIGKQLKYLSKTYTYVGLDVSKRSNIVILTDGKSRFACKVIDLKSMLEKQ